MKKKPHPESTLVVAPSALDVSAVDVAAAPETSPPRRERRSHSPDRWSGAGMPIYARAMASHPVLDAAGERRLAALIEERTIALGCTLLSD